MLRIAMILALAGLIGCSDWPDVGPRPSRAMVGWPDLVPISSLPKPEETGEQAANARLLARAAALRNRAALMRRPVPDDAAFERLRARLAT